MFIGPQVDVYTGMIVGENNRGEDLVINVNKGKQLTNMRTTSSDEATVLTPHRQLSLEECLEFINDDEALEITPKNIRIRKILLDENQRKRVTELLDETRREIYAILAEEPQQDQE